MYFWKLPNSGANPIRQFLQHMVQTMQLQAETELGNERWAPVTNEPSVRFDAESDSANFLHS
jgi:hypothetical protein